MGIKSTCVDSAIPEPDEDYPAEMVMHASPQTPSPTNNENTSNMIRVSELCNLTKGTKQKYLFKKKKSFQEKLLNLIKKTVVFVSFSHENIPIPLPSQPRDEVAMECLQPQHNTGLLGAPVKAPSLEDSQSFVQISSSLENPLRDIAVST